MSRCCEITRTKPLRGNKVSHSQRKTPRKTEPNLQRKAVFSSLLGKYISIRLTTKAMKTIDKLGGLDRTILVSHDKYLSDSLLKVKRQMLKVVKLSAIPASI